MTNAFRHCQSLRRPESYRREVNSLKQKDVSKCGAGSQLFNGNLRKNKARRTGHVLLVTLHTLVINLSSASPPRLVHVVTLAVTSGIHVVRRHRVMVVTCYIAPLLPGPANVPTCKSCLILKCLHPVPRNHHSASR